MKFRSLFIAALCTCTLSLWGQQSRNMSLLGTWHDPTLLLDFNRYSDVWGYAADGREYALLASQEFIHVLDVTDPSQISEVDRLNTYANSATIWRDVKVYDHYAYFVVDVRTTEGLQVIDLSDLPNSASIVFESALDFGQAHNMFIDTTSNPARLYLFGTSGGSASNDLMVYGLANPAAPNLLASIRLPEAHYIHDGYARNDTLYANQGNSGMYAYDVRDLQNPVQLSSLSNYIEVGYNHSSWGTADGKYLVMCDETVDTGVKMVALDKSDPFFLDMEVSTVFRSAISIPTSERSLAHNPYVLGDSLVVLSYYGDGIQVWNIQDRTKPWRLGYYDPTSTETYSRGIWGGYPWLPSGNILGSDMDNGLYVVKVDNFQIALPVEYTSWEAISDGKNAVLNWSTAAETDNAGWVVEHAREDGAFRALTFVPAGEGTYEYTHLTPEEGQHFYRLRQQDVDGTESISEIKTLTFGAAATSSLGAYPNPAPLGMAVTLVGVDTDDTWELRSSLGQVISTGLGNQFLTEYPAGTYFLRVVDKGMLSIILVD